MNKNNIKRVVRPKGFDIFNGWFWILWDRRWSSNWKSHLETDNQHQLWMQIKFLSVPNQFVLIRKLLMNKLIISMSTLAVAIWVVMVTKQITTTWIVLRTKQIITIIIRVVTSLGLLGIKQVIKQIIKTATSITGNGNAQVQVMHGMAVVKKAVWVTWIKIVTIHLI